MTDAELLALESLAKAATPGPWEYDVEQGEYHGVWADGCYIVPSLHIDVDNCKYIAAANPTVVLELIEELRQTRAERDWLKAEQYIDELNSADTQYRTIVTKALLIAKEATRQK